MKKESKFTIMALMVAMSVVGCSNKDDEPTKNSSEVQTTTTYETITESTEQLTTNTEANTETESEAESNTESETTTDANLNVIATSTRQECIDGIKQAAEAFKQGQQIVIRSNNAKLTSDTNKSLNVLYKWLLEEELYFDIYYQGGEGYVDFYIYQGINHVIPLKNINDGPKKIKEYIELLENPVGATFEIWCLEDEFLTSNGEGYSQVYLDEISYLCGYDVHIGMWDTRYTYDGIQVVTNNRVQETNRVYSTEELANYIKAKEKEANGMPARLNVYFHSDSIGEANYQEIISTMCKKEGIRTRYAKYVCDGVVYLGY